MKNIGGLENFLGIEVARSKGYSDQILADKERYQKLVGKLIYLSHTRPDIISAVSIVS